MNKSESKYFNTAQKMDMALIALLEEKDFEYITVKEICERADVNRSTFYLHYENTTELLEETTQYILDRHFSYYDVGREELLERLAQDDKRRLIFVTRDYLLPYLTFIKENRRIFKIAIRHFRVMNMEAVYGKLFKYIFEPILVRFRIPENERVYVIKYYLTGVFAVVMEWLDRDCEDDTETVMKVINDCVIGQRERNG